MNPFYLVRGFVEHLAQNAQKYWKLGQFLDIDEMSIYYKGRHKCRCYNPNKPEKWHFKAFCLNDGATGYLWNFYLYRGATEVRDPGWSATAFPIKKLTEPFVNIHHKGKNFVMCTDNWYTSFEVAEYLMDTYEVHLIGTVKVNRTGLPKNKIYVDKGARKKSRCEMQQCKTIRNGKPYYFVSWMDSRPVHGLSTLPTTQSLVQRKSKAEGSEVFRVISVPRPDLFDWYNHGMGGTDLHDQFNKYYRTQVRCNKWPIRIYTHFLTSCVTNAYIVYKSIKKLHTKDLSLKSFILAIIDAIVAVARAGMEMTA
jgi:Transposase IS4